MDLFSISAGPKRCYPFVFLFSLRKIEHGAHKQSIQTLDLPLAPGEVVREKYEAFKSLLSHDKKAHELMADLEEIYYGQRAVDFRVIETLYEVFSDSVSEIVKDLSRICTSKTLQWWIRLLRTS